MNSYFCHKRPKAAQKLLISPRQIDQKLPALNICRGNQIRRKDVLNTPTFSGSNGPVGVKELIEQLNVDIRKTKFSISFLQRKIDEFEVELRQQILESCFLFLLANIECNFVFELSDDERYARMRENHSSPVEKLAIMSRGFDLLRNTILEVQPEIDRIEDFIIQREDEAASLNQESLALLTSLQDGQQV